MEIKTLIGKLNSFGDINLLWIFLLENFALMILSVLIGYIVEYKNTIYPKKDTKWLVSTLLCNTLVTFVGFKLYILNFIQLSFEKSLTSIVFDLILITIIMDFFNVCISFLHS